eukprot:scaffold214057_cov26-Prasinocladus_malaysianus.AAC.2
MSRALLNLFNDNLQNEPAAANGSAENGAKPQTSPQAASTSPMHTSVGVTAGGEMELAKGPQLGIGASGNGGNQEVDEGVPCTFGFASLPVTP